MMYSSCQERAVKNPATHKQALEIYGQQRSAFQRKTSPHFVKSEPADKREDLLEDLIDTVHQLVVAYARDYEKLKTENKELHEIQKRDRAHHEEQTKALHLELTGAAAPPDADEERVALSSTPSSPNGCDR